MIGATPMNTARYYITMVAMLAFYFSWGFVAAAVGAIPDHDCRMNFDDFDWLRVILGCTGAGLGAVKAFIDPTMVKMTGLHPPHLAENK